MNININHSRSTGITTLRFKERIWFIWVDNQKRETRAYTADGLIFSGLSGCVELQVA